MIKVIDIKPGAKLEDYDRYAVLAMGLRELHTEALTLMRLISGRKVWMVSSTEKGGGIAEMMPRLVNILRQCGVTCDWVIASAEKPGFFELTKKIHNLIHDSGNNTSFTTADRELYDEVNRKNAEELQAMVTPGDIVVIHDPQPMAIAHCITQVPLSFVWRSHIGLDKQTERTKAAWDFLQPYASAYQLSVFSAPEYIPSYFTGRSVIIPPSIDPLDHKNRELSVEKMVGILCNANLVTEYHPVLTPPFTDTTRRLQPDGSFQSPLLPTDMGLLFKPMILQVSRWDNLKGFLPLMQGFANLKKNTLSFKFRSPREARRAELVQLVLAGPDPGFVNDDPEGKQVLEELCAAYLSLDRALQNDISILVLPMTSIKHNNLIVNALQRTASVVVQNSKQEGFGLTVTEAMWKTKPVIGTVACGIRQQVRDDIDGKLINDPGDPIGIARMLHRVLHCGKEQEVWAQNAHKRVVENFLIFNQARRWIRVFASLGKNTAPAS